MSPQVALPGAAGEGLAGRSPLEVPRSNWMESNFKLRGQQNLLNHSIRHTGKCLWFGEALSRWICWCSPSDVLNLTAVHIALLTCASNTSHMSLRGLVTGQAEGHGSCLLELTGPKRGNLC